MSKQTKTAAMKAIKMPSLSDTMESGHLLRWLKKPGDKINKGDILAEIETDKSVIDMEAFDEGYLVAPLTKEDTDIAVGEIMAYISQTAGGGNASHASPRNCCRETIDFVSDCRINGDIKRNLDGFRNQHNTRAGQNTPFRETGCSTSSYTF